MTDAATDSTATEPTPAPLGTMMNPIRYVVVNADGVITATGDGNSVLEVPVGSTQVICPPRPTTAKADDVWPEPGMYWGGGFPIPGPGLPPPVEPEPPTEPVDPPVDPPAA